MNRFTQDRHPGRRSRRGVRPAAFAGWLALFACGTQDRDFILNDSENGTLMPGGGAEPQQQATPGELTPAAEAPAPSGATPPTTDETPATSDEGAPGDLPLTGADPGSSGDGTPPAPAGMDGQTMPPATDGQMPPATDPGETPAEPPVTQVPEIGTVEDNGADCPVPELPSFDQLPTLTTLPDPFLGMSGERIATRAQWRCRRQEIRKLAERFIYGEKPARPESVSGSVSNTSITVNVQNQGRNASFTATVSLPQGATGPVPAIIGYGGSPFQDTISQEGVAFINYNLDTVGNETTRNPKQGAFYTVNPDRQDSGMLVAWAWGLSRIIDVIEQSGAQIIDPGAIGVTGCSRNGKGAFIAGAFDERVALTIPFESGMSGVPAFRLIVPEGGEVLRNAFEYRPWAGDAYQQFLQLTVFDQNDTAGRTRDNEASGQLQFRLPVDTHEVIGMIAPRGLFVMGNPHIVNLAPRSEHVTVLAGAEIYSALGAERNITYLSNIQNGTHCAFRQEFVPPLQQNIRRFLRNDPNATTGSIEAHANATGQLAPNIAWETPTLE